MSGMDTQTVDLYDQQAATIAARLRQIEPRLVYQLIAEHFVPGGRTADIGCGSGRDTAWLQARGFPTVGYDASRGMLAQARAAFPDLELHFAALPDLDGVADQAFDNVLCNAVLMHVPRTEHGRALRAFARILGPGGRLILTFRASRGPDEREKDGRLFASIPPEHLSTVLRDAAALRMLCLEHEAEEQRPDVRWFMVVAEKA